MKKRKTKVEMLMGFCLIVVGIVGIAVYLNNSSHWLGSDIRSLPLSSTGSDSNSLDLIATSTTPDGTQDSGVKHATGFHLTCDDNKWINVSYLGDTVDSDYKVELSDGRTDLLTVHPDEHHYYWVSKKTGLGLYTGGAAYYVMERNGTASYTGCY